MPILLTIRTLSIYVLSIILSISLFITLMINPSVQTKASNNTKEFLHYYVINFEDGSNLSETQTIIDELLNNNNAKSEITYKL